MPAPRLIKFVIAFSALKMGVIRSFIAEDDLSNEYSDYWQDKHYDLLKNNNYEILQLQTTGNLKNNTDNKMIPEMKYGSGTTIYKIKRNIF